MRNCVRRIISLLLGVLLLSGMLLCAAPATAADSTVCIDIIELTDIHGKIGSSTDAIAGRMAALIESVRQNRRGSTLLIGGGDFYTADAGELSNRYYGAPVQAWMDYLGFDVQVIGNHEFEWGIDKVFGFMSTSPAAFLSCNILKKDHTPYFERGSVILNKNGVRILIVGSICELPYTVSGDTVIGDATAYTKAEIDRYSRSDYDLIIPVNHGDGAVMTSLAELADEGYPVACVFGGHSHDLSVKDYYTPGGHHVPYYVADAYNHGLIHVQLNYNKSNGSYEIVEATKENNYLPLGTENPAASNPYYKTFSEAWQIIKDWDAGVYSVPAAAAEPAEMPARQQPVLREGRCGDALHWSVSPEVGLLTISGSGDMYNFGTDAAPWSAWNDSITELILPDGLTRIGQNAFAGSTALRSVTIPDSVTSIAPWAFCGDTELTELTLPNGIRSIGRYAFYGCSALQSAVIPEGTEAVGECAFRGTTLTELTLPDSVLSVGDGVIKDTPLYRSLLAEKKPVYLGNHLLQVDSLTAGTLAVRDGTVSIADCALYDCQQLTAVTLPDSLQHIGDWSLYHCSKLSKINIPDKVRQLGEFAFCCDGLSSVSVGSGVQSIGFEAFFFCPKLSAANAVNIKNIRQWCEIRFTDKYSNPLYYARRLYINGTLLTALNVPEGTAYISPYAFYLCEALQTATLPTTVSSIGREAFWGCANLTQINLPEGLSSLEKGVFENCYYLKGLVIPASVKTIAAKAFASCSRLRYVIFAGEPPKVDKTAFLEAAPNTAAGVYYGTSQAWKDFSKGGYGGNLVWIPLSGTLTSALGYTIKPADAQLVISGSDMMPSISGFKPWIPEPLQGFLRRLSFDSKVKSIASWSFANLTALTSVVIPSNIGSIGSDAFRGCTALTAVYILNSKCTINNTSNQTLGVPGKTVIYGYAGSTAQSWAKANGYTFVALNCGGGVHAFAYTKTVQPTCLQGGYALYTCALCGKTENREAVLALGHGYIGGSCVRCGVAEGDPCADYTDIKRNKWYHSAADFAISCGIMGSTQTGVMTFEPDTACTRSMIVSILYRLSDSPAVTYEARFPDVKPGKWFSDAVIWAYQNGIVSGYGNGNFGPNDKITREQMAVILKGYADFCGKDTSARTDLSGFPDCKKVKWSKDAVQWAVAENLISGKASGGQTLLDPQGNATRAEVASILMRFIQNILNG